MSCNWDHSENRLNQWETTLQCNVVSHWLSPYPEISNTPNLTSQGHCLLSDCLANATQSHHIIVIACYYNAGLSHVIMCHYSMVNDNGILYMVLQLWAWAEHRSYFVNSLRPSDAYMHALVPIILTLRNKLQWNFNQNSYICIQENTLKNIVCEISDISSRPQCVN